ncbi:MAG: glycosyltransferase family 4 protein [Brevundimonas sp.]
MTPRRVFMTADAVGGVWTYALDLSAGLVGTGIEVTLATLGPSPSPAQRRAAEAVAGLRLIETDAPLDWLDDARFADGARRLADLARDEDADLIHLNTPALAAEATFHAPVVGACHSCLATWWSACGDGEMSEVFAARTERLARAYLACDRLIAPSRAFAEATAARYGVRPEPVLNGRSGPDLRPPARREPVALTSGRLWDRAKNVATLDRAAARMRNLVHAAGPLKGPGGDQVKLDAVLALGPLSPERLRAQLGAARVFVSVPLYEPFGLGVLEAAQAGCALVLSDIPSLRELWDGAAVFVPPDDDARLAGELDELLDDGDRAHRLGVLAARRAGRYTVEAMTAATLAVYAQILHAPSTRAERAA